MKTFIDLADDYRTSLEYKELRLDTQRQYDYHIAVASEHFGKTRLSKIAPLSAKKAYDTWCNRGVSFANHVMSAAKIVFNHGVRMEIVSVNPFDKVKRRETKARRVVWSQKDIQKFLEVAYSDFSTRNIGLIAQMAYEWCQRLGDMRVLEWTSIQFDKQTVHIEQSKRRAEVFLPISDELCEMLQEQQDDFGFQSYVAPRPYPIDGVYKPYSLYKLPKFARQLMDQAGLSRDLRLSDLRRTGTTEMVDAGVSIGQIMSVTGHANPQSVKPYMKHTYDSANYALTKRKNHAK
jgi:integrase